MLLVVFFSDSRKATMSESGGGNLEDHEADEEAENVEIDRGSSIESTQNISLTADEQDYAELPVIAYKAEIMECIRENRIVICISETGRCTSIATCISHRRIRIYLMYSAQKLVKLLHLLSKLMSDFEWVLIHV